jgi:hypothetical protein
MEPAELRTVCSAQVARLLAFRDLNPRNTILLREYRDWLEAHCADERQARELIDDALKLESRPTIADLNRIWLKLHPAPSAEPELTPEEREHQKEWQRNWYAEELRGAEERRRQYLEWRDKQVAAKRPIPLNPIRIESLRPITREDVDRTQRIAREAENKCQSAESSCDPATCQDSTVSKSAV